MNLRHHFDPFYVKTLEPLKDLVEQQRVYKDEELLVLEKNGQHLAILTRHMAYHHVAQGDLKMNPGCQPSEWFATAVSV